MSNLELIHTFSRYTLNKKISQTLALIYFRTMFRCIFLVISHLVKYPKVKLQQYSIQHSPKFYASAMYLVFSYPRLPSKLLNRNVNIHTTPQRPGTPIPHQPSHTIRPTSDNSDFLSVPLFCPIPLYQFINQTLQIWSSRLLRPLRNNNINTVI
jgi:hypothetical protein